MSTQTVILRLSQHMIDDTFAVQCARLSISLKVCLRSTHVRFRQWQGSTMCALNIGYGSGMYRVQTPRRYELARTARGAFACQESAAPRWQLRMRITWMQEHRKGC
eukprot:354781-Pleurochrysis_carterae.AAC.1